ncbi:MULTISPECIES: asparaginase [Peribacillus]|uniref:asparaginase n=1 Tax=Peribacillus TaxID=2675229 RepID=UPI001F4EDA25|nr:MULTISPECIES: asparaginase [unclassified Peribacillus]MCK1982405.1 asparaginase [Peribacillus sp. Aquil_B1]MCK2009426.1 asparaginase [Peribacillus sp. Aquil_B8]
MGKISLITTGGTIASKETMNGMLASGALTGHELASLCELPTDIEVKVVDLFQISSMSMSFEKMEQLKSTIQKELEDPDVTGIVVTHGTDTLEETAYFLDVTIKDQRPIVITGSQRSPQEVGTDVYSNLRNSILCAASDLIRDVGVVVVFNERIYSAKYVKKVHASNLQGFVSFGYGYLGIIDNDVVSIYQKPLHRECFDIQDRIPRVDIIKCHTGSDGLFIDAAVANGAKGIVLEGVGRGQVTPVMVTSIQAAIDKGITVIMTTSAEEGKVYPAYDYEGSAFDLKQRGVILGADYDSKKARIKLAVILASENTIDETFFKY